MKTVTGLLWPLLLALLLSLPLELSAAQPTSLHHTISISFDLKEQLLRGTSRLSIPANRGLGLRCGSLTVTGTVLERAGQTPQTPAMGAGNILRLPPSPQARELYLSWELSTRDQQDQDNLISAQGITLAGSWHPLADQAMTFTLKALIPRHFTAISEAETIISRVRGKQREIQTSFTIPLAGIHFVAGPYQVQSRRLGELTLSSYFFAEDAQLAAEYLDRAQEYIRSYEGLIGPFPYNRYSIVENRLPTGLAMPTFTLLGQAVIRLPFIKDTSLGHEILHSWWGNGVFVAPASGNWSEGLTSYLADHLQAEQGQRAQSYRKNRLLRYDAAVPEDNLFSLAQFRDAGHDQADSRLKRAVGYDRAAMLFHMLRQKLGTTLFQEGLRDFYRNNRFSYVGWEEIEASFSRVSGQNLSPFFSQWLQGSDIPNLGLEQLEISQEQGGSVIRFELVQQSREPYTLEIPIRITTLGGIREERITTNSSREQVELHSDYLPRSLSIDPGYDLLRRLSRQEWVPTWAHYLGAEQARILVPAVDAEPYQPLIQRLRQLGAELKREEEVSNRELQQGAWLFLGKSGQRSSLFADPGGTTTGFSLQVRENPLKPEGIMVLVDSASREETRAAAGRLDHYGKYSTLLFQGGQIREKRVQASVNGIQAPLIAPPQGVPTRALLDFSQIVGRLAASRVIYIGESHTDYSAHLLQLQLIQALYLRNPKMVIGMEMFPRSSQAALDRYSSDPSFSEQDFLQASRYFQVWGYDYRLYREIISFARAHQLPMVGLNLDKALTSSLFHSGNTDQLSSEQLATVAAERDLSLPGYRQRLEPIFRMHRSRGSKGFAGFIQAQALWDETMAESVVFALRKFPEHQLVVIAGRGHVDRRSGIPPRVQRRLPALVQRVVIPEGGSNPGGAREEEADFLIPTRPMELRPAGKMGVVLEQRDEETVRISRISPHGQAAEAGLQAGDIITAVAGTPVTSVADLKCSLLDRSPGDQVDIRVRRQGQQLHYRLELSNLQPGRMPREHPRFSVP
ncbi:ChaN family lipoprotein [Desulfogranum mediterraneum]|uniref:ChaN family lipoprotein n=1 Tax=Desulfogranum mediterraneum TaxID=160661 RepID=UPI0004296A41|nr:ChaN family lipoprotein [Desulfogranum mediterraneum]